MAVIRKFGHKQDSFLTETASFFYRDPHQASSMGVADRRQEAVHSKSEIHTIPTIQGSGSKPEIYSASQEISHSVNQVSLKRTELSEIERNLSKFLFFNAVEIPQSVPVGDV